jgi:hypothetical protein
MPIVLDLLAGSGGLSSGLLTVHQDRGRLAGDLRDGEGSSSMLVSDSMTFKEALCGMDVLMVFDIEILAGHRC